MSKNYFFVGTLLLSSLLVSCGATPGSTSYLGKKPLAGNAKVVLQIFAGYSCSSCNEELPEVNSRIANELNEKAALVDARVYVVAGPNWSKATQEVADRYGQELGLDQFQMMVDNRCQTEYRKYYPGTSCLVPATVLLDPSGEVVQIYEPGKIDLDDFMARLKEIVNG